MLAEEHKLQVFGNSVLGVNEQAIWNSSLAQNFHKDVSLHVTK